MIYKFRSILFLVLVILLVQNCKKIDIIDPIGFETVVEADSIIFAIIGDYGKSGDAEKAVADMVKSWNPDFIITLGDNNYVEGKFSTIKENITKYYGDYIYNYDAPCEYQCNGFAFEEGVNRFFPTPGNHDGNNRNGIAPYLNYFTLPGQEKYYKFIWGPVTFYSIDSESGSFGWQEEWLYDELAKTYTVFNIVYFHNPPWNPAAHNSNETMQWDFYQHDVDFVLTGHDHVYSRIEKLDEQGMYYIINGLGGSSLYSCNPDKLPSDLFDVFCYDDNYGAIKATATNYRLQLMFYAISDIDNPIDTISIYK